MVVSELQKIEKAIKLSEPSGGMVTEANHKTTDGASELVGKLLSAVFFGSSSMLMIVVNKLVLTSFKFPSFECLALGQIVIGILILRILKLFNIVSYMEITWETIKMVWPLPLFYSLNLLFGLGGTQMISLPMFTVLRRFAILFTMIAEYFILNVHASMATQMSVYMMMIGTIVAGYSDLAFDLKGYFFVLMNDVATSANAVYTKQKLDARKLSTYGLLYHNFAFMFPITVCIVALKQETLHKVMNFDHWNDLSFLTVFGLSCSMGFVLQYATILCTDYNSALTTDVVGVLKNISVTYGGMFIGGDYMFSINNFIGINISLVGSLIYSYLAFKVKHTKPVDTQESNGKELKGRENI